MCFDMAFLSDLGWTIDEMGFCLELILLKVLIGSLRNWEKKTKPTNVLFNMKHFYIIINCP